MDANDMSRQFLESTVDLAVIHCSLDGTIEAWLGASEHLLGYAAAEAIGQPLALFFTEDDKRRGLDVHEIEVARTQGRSEDDRWHVRKDGSTFWASGVLSEVRDRSGSAIGLCKVLRDKTDVRTQLQSLENKVAALEAERNTEREVVGSLTHELRNPLMPIISALALLQRPDAAHVSDKAIKILVNQVGVLKRLLDDLSAVTLEPASTPRLRFEPMNLNATLSELIEGLHAAAKARHQTLSLVLPAAPIWISADPQRLQQMMLNLLNNALKYTGEGGRVGVSASVEADMAVIRVDDTGIGISPDMLPRIFELFTREGRSPEVEGKGVGLAVVKQLAAAHGGFVEARSAGLYKGSNFSLRLPMHRWS